MKPVRIIENPSEIGAGTRGASLGPGAIRVASSKAQSSFFRNRATQIVADSNHLLFAPADTPNAKYIAGIVGAYERVMSATSSSLQAGELPFLVAGDHSSAGGTIAGIKTAFPEKKLGVVWIDAHADLHSPYTTPSGNVHGMPLATALGLDNTECGVNEISQEEQKHWEELKSVGGITPKIRPEDLVFIAVRDTEEPEDEIIRRHNIRSYSVEEVRKEGPQQVVQWSLEHLHSCDIIYVSFDVDSLDSSISVGTGTPVPNGLLVDEAKALLVGFATDSKICCMEFVEVNPTLDDKGNAMAETAFELLESTVEVLEDERHGN